MSPVKESQRPCWRVVCDNCGETEGHFPTRHEAVEGIERHGWYVIRGLFNEPVEFYCTGCAGEMIDRMQRLRLVWITE